MWAATAELMKEYLGFGLCISLYSICILNIDAGKIYSTVPPSPWKCCKKLLNKEVKDDIENFFFVISIFLRDDSLSCR
jgi:hypothetical protein